jgi:hypothetical protein
MGNFACKDEREIVAILRHVRHPLRDGNLEANVGIPLLIPPDCLLNIALPN